MVKEATCLCPVKNDETDTKGRFTIGKNSWHLTQADGAPMYDLAFNVLTNEYKFTPVQGEAIFDTNPQLYFTSSNNEGEWHPLVPVHSDATMSWIITYLHEGEEFKFAPQASADNAFGATAQINDLANMNPSTSNGYIKAGNAGWYLLQVINDGAAQDGICFRLSTMVQTRLLTSLLQTFTYLVTPVLQAGVTNQKVSSLFQQAKTEYLFHLRSLPQTKYVCV